VRQIKELEIQGRILLFTGITDEQLAQLYNQALALVYPSLYEGFGLPLLEAMACGCPIVASRIPSTIEVAGDCPAYFELGNRTSLIAALDIVYLEGADSSRITMGLERAAQFSWDKTAKETLALYHYLHDE
jgi:glycosyltransferase involved in cell wall biosynthesis